jgi:hypothetical protein
MTLNLELTFDKNNYRHYMNGFQTVLHCHHYMSLTTKAALEYQAIGGLQILMESAEDSIRPVLDDYFTKNPTSDVSARLNIGAEFYAAMGMGKMSLSGSGAKGEAVLTRSHVDQGWIKKWGKTNIPVNHFTCGFIAGVFAAAFQKPARSYQVTELSSIVKGDAQSRFSIVAK